MLCFFLKELICLAIAASVAAIHVVTLIVLDVSTASIIMTSLAVIKQKFIIGPLSTQDQPPLTRVMKAFVIFCLWMTNF